MILVEVTKPVTAGGRSMIKYVYGALKGQGVPDDVVKIISFIFSSIAKVLYCVIYKVRTFSSKKVIITKIFDINLEKKN